MPVTTQELSKKYIKTPNGYVEMTEDGLRANKKESKQKSLFWKTPKYSLVTILISIMLFTSVASWDLNGLLNGLVAVVCSPIVDLIFTYSKTKKSKIPDGAIITGLIIAMVLSSVSPSMQQH